MRANWKLTSCSIISSGASQNRRGEKKEGKIVKEIKKSKKEKEEKISMSERGIISVRERNLNLDIRREREIYGYLGIRRCLPNFPLKLRSPSWFDNFVNILAVFCVHRIRYIAKICYFISYLGIFSLSRSLPLRNSYCVWSIQGRFCDRYNMEKLSYKFHIRFLPIIFFHVSRLQVVLLHKRWMKMQNW